MRVRRAIRMVPSMIENGQSVRIELGGIVATWFRMPATTTDPHGSTTAADTMGVSFTGHRGAVVERPSGRRDALDIEPNALFITCDEPLDWVHVAEPYEGVEFELSPEIVQRTAEMHGVPVASKPPSAMMAPDPVFWSMAVRMRLHALGVAPVGDLEGEELAQSLLSHFACEHLGGTPERQNGRPLDGRRLARVTDHVQDNMSERLSVSDLAGVASMSTNHFHAAFRQATGLTPHQFVTARRVERALELIGAGRTREEAARAVGYTAGHAFRRALARFAG